MNIDIVRKCKTLMKFDNQVIPDFEVVALECRNNITGGNIDLRIAHGMGSIPICDYFHIDEDNNELILVEKTKIPTKYLDETNSKRHEKLVDNFVFEIVNKIHHSKSFIITVVLKKFFYWTPDNTKFILVLEKLDDDLNLYHNFLAKLESKLIAKSKGTNYDTINKVVLAQDMNKNYKHYLTKKGFVKSPKINVLKNIKTNDPFSKNIKYELVTIFNIKNFVFSQLKKTGYFKSTIQKALLIFSKLKVKI